MTSYACLAVARLTTDMRSSASIARLSDYARFGRGGRSQVRHDIFSSTENILIGNVDRTTVIKIARWSVLS